jgi:hypothetical protein
MFSSRKRASHAQHLEEPNRVSVVYQLEPPQRTIIGLLLFVNLAVQLFAMSIKLLLPIKLGVAPGGMPHRITITEAYPAIVMLLHPAAIVRLTPEFTYLDQRAIELLLANPFIEGPSRPFLGFVCLFTVTEIFQREPIE